MGSCLHKPCPQAESDSHALLLTRCHHPGFSFSASLPAGCSTQELISEVNLVIFYDNVPSSIRFIQRRGRTGRKASGRLVVLIAKDTIDEVYYWIGRRKIASSKTMGEKLSKKLEAQEITSESLDSFL